MVIKRRYSALIQGSSDLELILQDYEIENVVICGVAMDFCCNSSARDAMMLNYRTSMVSDAASVPNLHNWCALTRVPDFKIETKLV